MTKPESTLRNKSRAENPSRESHNLGESLDYSGAGFSGDGLFESIGQYGLAIGLALSVLVLALRFAPLPENFSGFGALAIFCGLFGKGFQRWLIPLLTLFAADCIGHFGHIRGMGFYAPQTMLLNYLGFAVMTGIEIGRAHV